LKKFLLLILITLIGYSPAVFAGFWESLGSCFIDPCNCLLDPKERTEYHQGIPIRTVNKNYVCPPWNKEGGRHDNTCLVLKHYPNTPTGVYENLCAEATPESTYFNPKIRVRGQQCNTFACWTTENTLDWGGDCITLAGGYGAFPLHRMCARIALPKDEAKDFAQDPGYTNGKHLDTQGSTIDDDVIIGRDGNPIIFEAPKLCLYRDPSFVSVSTGLSFDLMDLDPFHQPMHKTDKIHPIVEVLLFFLSISVESSSSLSDLVSSTYASQNNLEDGMVTEASATREIIIFIGEVIKWVGGAIKGLLEEVGQLNREVDSTIYGCVNLPLGPFPPPFCEQVSPFFQVAEVQNICPTGSDGNALQSVENNECHVSTVKNNYIRNSVRVGYESLAPLCRAGEDPMVTDKCVNIENLGAFSSSIGMHTATARRDLIKHCDAAVSGAPCIRTSRSHSCSVTNNGCQDGFRVVYGRNLGGVLSPSAYFRDDIPDCPSSSSATCQEIWGVNLGEFQDISLTFPTEELAYDIAPLTDIFTLVDKSDRTADFTASIVRISGFDPVYDFRQEPKQICVFEGDFVVGCKNRISNIKPSVYECGSAPNSTITCSSDYFAPKFIVSYNVGSDSTSALIEPESVYNTTGLNSVINLAGDGFESFVSDNTFTVKPFSGANSPNPSSLFGKYQDDILPVVGTTINQDAVYLSGLEYITGKYHLGGEYACLSSNDLTKCPDNPSMCVLSRLLNKDTVLCSTFFAKAMDHNGLSLCSATQTVDCNVLDSMPAISGGSIAIRSCAGGIKCYDGTEELCQTSYAPSDRVDPLASLGNVLEDDQYYDTEVPGAYPSSPSSSAVNYDRNLYGVRDKTSIELGLCVAVPQGVCPAETESNEDTGFANWPAVNLGEISTGTCQADKIPVGPSGVFVRQCVANPDTKSFNLEPIYRIQRDASGAPNKIYPTNIKCVTPTCSGESANNADTGFASWPAALLNENSQGICHPGKSPAVSASALVRQCVLDPATNTYILEPVFEMVVDGSGAANKVYSTSVKCLTSFCPAETENNADTGFATWPSVGLDADSVGTCHSGKIPVATAGDLVRKCVRNPVTNLFNLEPISDLPPTVKCVTPSCPAENFYDESTGFASWPSVNVGENSQGTCRPGLIPARASIFLATPNIDLVRKCEFNPATNSYKLEPVNESGINLFTVWFNLHRPIVKCLGF
jgi:hypothetical protein